MWARGHERNRLSLLHVRRVARVEDPDSAAERLRNVLQGRSEQGWIRSGERVAGERTVALPGLEVDGLIAEQDIAGAIRGSEPGPGRIARLRLARWVAVEERRRLLVRPTHLSGQQHGDGDERGSRAKPATATAELDDRCGEQDAEERQREDQVARLR
jgi:hypothetical protein